jgi:pimeloyl-ACP methyl ester carboxylesterase
MNPLFFGAAESPLYGVYHPPKGAPRSAGVVLCYPFGQEYMRAHRAFRQLALLLTKQGYHVLRFDYRGTGDSWGDMAGLRAQDWLADIDAAIAELRDSAGVASISVLGLRLGALIAAAACLRRDDIDRLILWDPILSGALYERELLAEIEAEQPSEYHPPSGNADAADGTLYYNGFAIPASFREELRALELCAMSPLGVKSVLQAVSHETGPFEQLRTAWNRHPGYRYQYTEAPHDWNYVDNFGGILLPQPVIQAIVNWME